MIETVEDKINRVGLSIEDTLRDQVKRDIISRWIQSLEGFQDSTDN